MYFGCLFRGGSQLREEWNLGYLAWWEKESGFSSLFSQVLDGLDMFVLS
jgi:hypothetical protein